MGVRAGELQWVDWGGNGSSSGANEVRECCRVESNCFVGGDLRVAWMVWIVRDSMLGAYERQRLREEAGWDGLYGIVVQAG